MIKEFQGKYRFLSNFWPSTVKLDGCFFATVEHAYQAAKTLDHDWRQDVWAAPSPGAAKRIGRRVPIRPDWNEVKLQIMEDLLRQKFTSQVLLQQLLDTGIEELQEGNTWGDRYWGVCQGVGENQLGKLLMKIRKEYEAR